ncbi:unnamed protein product [Didymodactylos carnosus]|uniref:Uncharacterized protein n=1 Tax=Didymodactylos carnosus TaxID=1234261 RepID=A0A813ZYM4_9BILA|nr:unnamed protein product [Didymodactylos carnosus]CAF3687006.1 unnamed protein product [Didymodactylos carnosus]
MTNETKKSLKRPLDSINQHETKSKKFRTSLTLKELRRPTETSTVDVRSRNCPYLDTINRYDCYCIFILLASNVASLKTLSGSECGNVISKKFFNDFSPACRCIE